MDTKEKADKSVEEDVKLKKDIILNLKRSNMIMFALIICMVYLGTLIIAKKYTIAEYEMKKNSLSSELANKEQEIKELKELIENAQDSEFIEKIARENLKMVRPDETVYMVVK